MIQQFRLKLVFVQHPKEYLDTLIKSSEQSFFSKIPHLFEADLFQIKLFIHIQI